MYEKEKSMEELPNPRKSLLERKKEENSLSPVYIQILIRLWADWRNKRWES